MYSKRCNIALCLCILLHLIYHKDKTGVVYSKRCNIAYVIAYCCIRYIRRTKLVLYIQKGAISPTSLHFAASDISYFRTRLVLCIQKIAISPCLCILLHDTCTYHYMIVNFVCVKNKVLDDTCTYHYMIENFVCVKNKRRP